MVKKFNAFQEVHGNCMHLNGKCMHFAPVLFEQSDYTLKYSDSEIIVNIILYIQTYFSNIEV